YSASNKIYFDSVALTRISFLFLRNTDDVLIVRKRFFKIIRFKCNPLLLGVKVALTEKYP
ncbi:hypothetical protein, partial [Atlantibacter hermannii]|uniref:hypothetical protein n=1 Tax=Atlantibacter hermannii TaxID=565 RepID=UPI0028A8230A